MIKYVLGFIISALIFWAFFVGYQDYQGLVRPLPLHDHQILYEYQKGTSIKSLAKDMAEKGWIPSASVFTWYVRLTSHRHFLYAGEYAITQGMSAQDLVDKMRKHAIYMHALRVPDGGTLQDVMSLIQTDVAIKQTILRSADWFHLIAPDYASGEGLLLPETYFFPKNEEDIALLKRAHRDMMGYAQKTFDERDPTVPFQNVYNALIVASIIEKEAALPDERTKIARVIINRLAKNMPLQMDPTVVYGMGSAFTGKLTKKDLQTPGPYNTYLNPGLPPTPICMPSKNAIWAALHPAEGNYLYFVSRGDGSHYFSDTLKAHNEAVVKYIIRPKKDPAQ